MALAQVIRHQNSANSEKNDQTKTACVTSSDIHLCKEALSGAWDKPMVYQFATKDVAFLWAPVPDTQFVDHRAHHCWQCIFGDV